MASVVSGKGIGSPIGHLSLVTTSSNNSTAVITSSDTSTVNLTLPNTSPSVIKIAPEDTSLVNLSRLDLLNLDTNIIPASNSTPPNLGAPSTPFGDLFLSGNTLHLSDRTISIATVGGASYINLGSNVIVGNNSINSTAQIVFKGELNISELGDANTTGISNGQFLRYNSSTSQFEPADSLAGSISSLSDVDIPGSLTHGQVLAFNSSTSNFEPTSNLASNIEDLGNVDTTGEVDGSFLQYNAASQSYETVQTVTNILDTRLSLGGGTLSGNVSFGNNHLTNLATPVSNTDAVTKAYVDEQISSTIDSAPEALDTLNELAAALDDDANFASTITNQLADKAANTYVNEQLNLKSTNTYVNEVKTQFDNSINELDNAKASNTYVNDQLALKASANLVLADVSNVSNTAPTSEQILQFQGSTWTPVDANTVIGGGGGGSSTLTELTDTNLSGTPSNGHALVYNASSGKWEAGAVTSSGTLTGTDVKELLEDVDGQVMTTNNISASVASAYVVDSFSINTLRSAKYVITINDSDDTTYYIAELLLVHNGSTVTFTLYGETTVGSLDIFPSYSSDIVSSNVRLIITTTSDSQTIKVLRQGFKI